MPTLFESIRLAAADKWRDDTNREGCGIDECYANTIECLWQCNAQDNHGYCHISLFCSLADWACNITDVLTDARLDDLDLEDKTSACVIARFYTRFLLVASELFCDLEQLAMDARQDNDRQRGRRFLSPDGDQNWLHDLHNFINRVCKHKYKNLHRCNHHLPLCFDDLPGPCEFANPVRFGNTDIENGDAIQYPTLNSIIDGICNAGNALDTHFQNDQDAFRRICEKYDDESYAEGES